MRNSWFTPERTSQNTKVPWGVTDREEESEAFTERHCSWAWWYQAGYPTAEQVRKALQFLLG